MSQRHAERVRSNNDLGQENQNQDSVLMKLSSHVVSYDNWTSQRDNPSHVSSYETSRMQTFFVFVPIEKSKTKGFTYVQGIEITRSLNAVRALDATQSSAGDMTSAETHDDTLKPNGPRPKPATSVPRQRVEQMRRHFV
jgi:hypothetical protein